jgi:hypothetical protein
LVPRFSSTPAAAWTWPTWVVSRRRVLEAVFVLLEFLSPSRRIFIGSHSLPPLWFAASVLHLQNTSSKLHNSPRFHPLDPLIKAKLATRESWRKPKLHPKDLGEVGLATRAGLTSCTQQRTQGKNSWRTALKRAKISPERSSVQGEQTHKERSGKIKLSSERPDAVRPSPRWLDCPPQTEREKPEPRVNPQLCITRSLNSPNGSQ